MRFSVDMHFGYGAALAAGTSAGLLCGLYANEAIGLAFYLGSTLAYVAFHFLALWVHAWQIESRMEAARREYAADLYEQALAEREPVELLGLSSLRRAP